MERAFANLGADEQAALEAGILALVEEFNVATDSVMRVPSECVQTIVTIR